MRVPIQRALIDWAIARARGDSEELSARFGWLSKVDAVGEVHPTMKQLEKFASVVHAPIGYLFLPEPPHEKIPIPDFRTMSSGRDARPSPELIDTIHIAQNRQDWFKAYMLSSDLEAPNFVGSVRPNSDVFEVAGKISETLGFSVKQRGEMRSWTEALSKLVEQADDTGVLVMINGVVGNNTSRKLDPEEFRGFALFDNVAPLIFVNGADTKSAQMFTIVHELAHIWAGESALTDSSPEDVPSNEIERWCDKVAAEVLVPLRHFKDIVVPKEDIESALSRLAREYKVSTLVVLRRLFDLGELKEEEFWNIYEAELARLKAIVPSGSGGDFYNTQNFRVGRRFARALLESTFSGRTLYGDALRLMSVSNVDTLRETARRLEVV